MTRAKSPRYFFARVIFRAVLSSATAGGVKARQSRERVPAYCGTTAWNIDFAANSMSSATL
jgi:hypothetical protein